MRSTTSWVSGLSLAACLLQSGCSVVTPEPLWELTKAVGGIAAISVGQSPPQASNTTYNLRTPVTDLCIEFNPRTQVPDFLPALQAELQARGVSSRVYDSPPAARMCNVWLEYTAFFEWGMVPFTGEYRSYVSSVQLALRAKSGELLSSSQFVLDPVLPKGKWTDTRAKVSPVVTALLTGVQD